MAVIFKGRRTRGRRMRAMATAEEVVVRAKGMISVVFRHQGDCSDVDAIYAVAQGNAPTSAGVITDKVTDGVGR